MKHVAMGEFIAQVGTFVEGDEPIAVERDGRTIGYYTPTSRIGLAESRAALARLEETIARVTASSGMTEDELADLFDLNKPFPYDDEELAVASGTGGRIDAASR